VTALFSNVTFPAVWNTPITFTAGATGGPGPLQFKFVTYNSVSGWAVGQDYTTSNKFMWYPPQGQNAVQVWVRAAGSAAEYQDWMGSGMFTVAAAPAKVTALFPSVAFPALPTTPQTWTAFSSGGTGPVEYRFVRFDVGANTWVLLRDWSTNNQATWTPGATNSGWHVIQVWARSIGSNVLYEDWRGSDYLLVTTSGAVTVTPSRSLAGLRVGDLVTWTANVSGTGVWEYKFVTYDSTRGWMLLQDYSTSNTFAWYPPAGTCAMQVWIRAVGSHAYWERYTGSDFFIVNP
jgi:hypothetical protein